MAPRIFRKMGISSCSSTKFHYGKRVLKHCASVVPAVIFFRELVCQSKCFIVRNDARKYISLLLLQNNISLKLFWLTFKHSNNKLFQDISFNKFVIASLSEEDNTLSRTIVKRDKNKTKTGVYQYKEKKTVK